MLVALIAVLFSDNGCTDGGEESNENVLNCLIGDPNYKILSITDNTKKKCIDRLRAEVMVKKLRVEYIVVD